MQAVTTCYQAVTAFTRLLQPATGCYDVKIMRCTVAISARAKTFGSQCLPRTNKPCNNVTQTQRVPRKMDRPPAAAVTNGKAAVADPNGKPMAVKGKTMAVSGKTMAVSGKTRVANNGKTMAVSGKTRVANKGKTMAVSGSKQVTAVAVSGKTAVAACL